LQRLPGETAKQQSLDLSPILWVDEEAADQPQFCQVTSNDPFDTAEKANVMVADMLPAIEAASGGTFSYAVTNCDRSIGARLSGEIAKRHGNTEMESNPITVNLIRHGRSELWCMERRRPCTCICAVTVTTTWVRAWPGASW
jgi:glutamate synthase (NADPH/NADH) large chain